MERIYEHLLRDHLATERQMAIVAGPRQVGKTTSSRAAAGPHSYLNWDNQADRLLISRGPDAVADRLQLASLQATVPRIVFDELHKCRSWRTFLKGFFDLYGARAKIVVTGSARLGFFRRSGDSMMGRYSLYRMHPISVGELARSARHHADVLQTTVHPPARIDDSAWSNLSTFGGYPEPFLRAETRFYNRWRRLRTELLFRDDIRDLTRVEEAARIEVLGRLLAARAGAILEYSSLATDANVSVDTARRWTAILEALFFAYTVRPWFRNVPKSLRKQPKVYLWDWSQIQDSGARFENFIASHLLKAVHWWTDVGLGTFELHYLRDKAKREVDFLVTRDEQPWLLVEAKLSAARGLSPELAYFQRITGAPHAVQVVQDAPYVEADCFAPAAPTIVPARTFLSQLV